MKKAISLLLIFILTLSLTGTVFADTGQAMRNYNPYKNKTTIVEPCSTPCDYWPDARHRWQKGKVTEEYVDTGITEHRDVFKDGHKIGYKIYKEQKIYKIQEYYCACGETKDRRTYEGTRWKYVRTVYY